MEKFKELLFLKNIKGIGKKAIYVVAELRRILQHSGTTIEVATIKEPST